MTTALSCSGFDVPLSPPPWGSAASFKRLYRESPGGPPCSRLRCETPYDRTPYKCDRSQRQCKYRDRGEHCRCELQMGNRRGWRVGEVFEKDAGLGGYSGLLHRSHVSPGDSCVMLGFTR